MTKAYDDLNEAGAALGDALYYLKESLCAHISPQQEADLLQAMADIARLIVETDDVTERIGNMSIPIPKLGIQHVHWAFENFAKHNDGFLLGWTPQDGWGVARFTDHTVQWTDMTWLRGDTNFIVDWLNSRKDGVSDD